LKSISLKEKYIDIWRSIYAYAIPTIVCIIYIIIYMLTLKEVLNYAFITDSKYFTSMLESIITFVSLILGVFGFLLPILITSKDSDAMIKCFINSIDKRAFSFNLKMVIVSGFTTVFLSCMLFFFDVYDEWFKTGMILIWIWFLFYFMSNAYRFISLLISLFLKEKKRLGKETKNRMSEEEEKELKEQIKRNNKH